MHHETRHDAFDSIAIWIAITTAAIIAAAICASCSHSITLTGPTGSLNCDWMIQPLLIRSIDPEIYPWTRPTKTPPSTQPSTPTPDNTPPGTTNPANLR